jgi:hypothetical protein
MDLPKVVVKPGEGHSVWLGSMGVVSRSPGPTPAGPSRSSNTRSDRGGSCSPMSTGARTSIPTSWGGRSVRGSVTTRSPRARVAT